MKIKRFLSVFLAAMVLCSFCIFVSAAPVTDNNTDGSITVNSQVTDRTYTAYQVFKEVASSDAGSGNSYSVNAEFNAFFQQYLTTKNVTKNPSTEASYKDSEIVSYVSGLNAAGARDLTDALAGFIQGAGGTTWTHSYSLTAGQATSVNLGYYVVVENAADQTSNGFTPSLVMLNTVDQSVTITAKEDSTTGGKQVEENSNSTYTNVGDFSVGQTVPYQLTATIPADAAAGLSTYSINLADQLKAGLAYKQIDSITITADGTNVTNFNEYLNNASLSVGGSKDTNFTGALPYTGIASGSSFALNFNFYNKDSRLNLINGKKIVITVKYSATVTAEAVINTGLDNTYTLTVDRDGHTTPIQTTATVYTYGLQITKTDTDGKPLPGAKFMLQYQKNDGSAGDYVTLTDQGNGVYEVAGSSSAKPGDAAQYTVVSNDNGLITVKGLDAGTYTLTETQAPTGYNILTKPATVTVTKNTSRSPTVYSSAQVKNSAAVTLPSTGGMGTKVFFIGGSVILLGAAAFLVLNRKKIFGK